MLCWDNYLSNLHRRMLYKLITYLLARDDCCWSLLEAPGLAAPLVLVLLLDAARLISSDDKPNPFSSAPTASKPASYSSSNKLLNPARHKFNSAGPYHLPLPGFLMLHVAGCLHAQLLSGALTWRA